MKYILVNYNYNPEWLLDYTDDYLIYDRSDNATIKDMIIHTFDPEKVIHTENIGNVDYDKLDYLVDNYDDLPDIFVWGKTNLFKYISQKEFDEVKNFDGFLPLLTQHHNVYSDKVGTVCFYKDQMYYERNDSWYVNEWKYFSNYRDFAKAFAIKDPDYIPFPPGGNFILTKEKVHKYGKDFYIALRDLLPYARLPSEAHMCERAYYSIWS